MPGEPYIKPPFDFNQPDFGWKPVIPGVRNLQVIDTTNPLNLQNIVKEDGGLRGAYDAMKFTLAYDKMRKIFPDVDKNTLLDITEQLNDNMGDYGINNNKLAAEFLAEVFQETGGLTKLIENLNYIDHIDPKTGKLAIPAAADRIAVTFSTYFPYKKDQYGKPILDKDGKKIYTLNDPKKYVGNPEGINDLVYQNYYGRNILQLSTKINYQGYNTFYDNTYTPKVDFVACPELIDDYPYGVRSGLWFFKYNVMNGLDMQKATIDDITAKINSASLGAKERRSDYYSISNLLEPYSNVKVLQGASTNNFDNPYSTYSYYYPQQLFSPFQQSIGVDPTLRLNLNQPYQSQPFINQSIFNPLGFNTTPLGIHNDIAPSITQPVIQNLTINNTTNSTMPPADIQKQIAEIIIGAAADANIKSGIA